MAYYFRLNYERRLLAVFSPKCACTTLKAWMNEMDRYGKGAEQTAGPALVSVEKAAQYRDYFKVLFLRDPLRRLASFYAHWVVRSPGDWSFADLDRRFWLDKKTFRQFIYALEHLHRNHLHFQHHLQPQTENLTEFTFDRVVLVENLLPGLRRLNLEQGCSYLPAQENNTHYNRKISAMSADRSPQWMRQHGVPEARWFYDSELRELCERIYSADVAYYRRYDGKILGKR